MFYGIKTCQNCGRKYEYPLQGGTMYCKPCRKKVRAAQERLRRQMIKQANDPSWKAQLQLPVNRLPSEVDWPWACNVCGLKHLAEERAIACCSDGVLDPEPPIHSRFGFIVWAGVIVMKDELIRQRILASTPSPLESTSEERNLAAPAVASCVSMEGLL